MLINKFAMHGLTSHCRLVYKTCVLYFQSHRHDWDTMVHMVDSGSRTPRVGAKALTTTAPTSTRLSLRMVDYVCTTYSRDVRVLLYDRSRCDYTDLRVQYVDAVDTYGKSLFDAFRRISKVSRKVDLDLHGAHFETTVGQLNFFRWAFEAGVVAWCQHNIMTIDIAMQKKKMQLVVVPRPQHTQPTRVESQLPPIQPGKTIRIRITYEATVRL